MLKSKIYKFWYPTAEYTECGRLCNKLDIMGDFVFDRFEHRCIIFCRRGRCYIDQENEQEWLNPETFDVEKIWGLVRYHQCLVVNVDTGKSYFTRCCVEPS